jgi:hypothetical protein
MSSCWRLKVHAKDLSVAMIESNRCSPAHDCRGRIQVSLDQQLTMVFGSQVEARQFCSLRSADKPFLEILINAILFMRRHCCWCWVVEPTWILPPFWLPSEHDSTEPVEQRSSKRDGVASHIDGQ